MIKPSDASTTTTDDLDAMKGHAPPETLSSKLYIPLEVAELVCNHGLLTRRDDFASPLYGIRISGKFSVRHVRHEGGEDTVYLAPFA